MKTLYKVIIRHWVETIWGSAGTIETTACMSELSGNMKFEVNTFKHVTSSMF